MKRLGDEDEVSSTSKIRKTESEEPQSPCTELSSYDLMVHQRQILMQWKAEKEEDDRQKLREDGESDSGETFPYGPTPSPPVQQSSPLPMDDDRGRRHSDPQLHARPVFSADHVSHTADSLKSSPRRTMPLAYRPPINRLSDLKVAELKDECRSRSLPMSGTKSQLTERLAQFEMAIVTKHRELAAKAANEPCNACSHAAAQQGSPSNDTRSTSSISPSSTVICEEGVDYPEPPPREETIVHPSVQVKRPVNTTLLPVQTATAAPQVVFRQQPNISAIPISAIPAAPQQLIQVVDQNGKVFTATVMSEAILSDTNAFRMCAVPSNGQRPAVLHRLQSVSNEPILRFAQNGCGGTLTFSHATTEMAVQQPVVSHPSPAKLQAVRVVQACQPTIPAQASNYSQAKQKVILVENSQHLGGHVQTVQVAMSNQKMQPSPISQKPSPANGNCSPVTGDQANSSPNLPPNATNNSMDNSTDSSDVPNVSSADSRFDEKTMSEHEEMLRYQQKKIEQLEQEIKKSQNNLKHQQNLIRAAKKQQVAEISKQTGGSAASIADTWLQKLDLKHMSNMNVQHFLRQRKQQKFLESAKEELKDLEANEIRMQREEHTEQAIQDIVRLIRQDNRTALLIVQLLRKYQLERNGNGMREDEPKRREEPGSAVAVISRPSNHRAEATHVIQQRQASRAQVRGRARICMPVNGSNAPPPVVVISDESDSPSPPHVEKKSIASDSAAEQPTTQVDMEEIFKSVLEPTRLKETVDDMTVSHQHQQSHSHHEHQQQQPHQQQLQQLQHMSQTADNTTSEMEEYVDSTTHYSLPHEDIEMKEEKMAVMQQTVLPSCQEIYNPAPISHSDILHEAVESSGIPANGGAKAAVTMIVEHRPLHVSPMLTHRTSEMVPDWDDLMDILRDDERQMTHRQSSDPLQQFNGTEELSKVLGSTWLDDVGKKHPYGVRANFEFDNAMIGEHFPSPSHLAENFLGDGEQMDFSNTSDLSSPFISADELGWFDDSLINPNNFGNVLNDIGNSFDEELLHDETSCM